MKKFDEMKMPEYYSDMDDSEKGLAGGSGGDDLKTTGYVSMGMCGALALTGVMILPPGANGRDAYVQRMADDMQLSAQQSGRVLSPEGAMRKANVEYKLDRLSGKIMIGAGVLGAMAGVTCTIIGACTDDD